MFDLSRSKKKKIEQLIFKEEYVTREMHSRNSLPDFLQKFVNVTFDIKVRTIHHCTKVVRTYIFHFDPN
jgi:hypothetical protein